MLEYVELLCTWEFLAGPKLGWLISNHVFQRTGLAGDLTMPTASSV